MEGALIRAARRQLSVLRVRVATKQHRSSKFIVTVALRARADEKNNDDHEDGRASRASCSSGAFSFVGRERAAQGADQARCRSDRQLDGVVGAIRAVQGDPFAAPPARRLRWREPQPVAKGMVVADASKSATSALSRTGQQRDKGLNIAVRAGLATGVRNCCI